MSASQEEQSSLEDWLDGELGEQACQELRERLSRDPVLAAELARLQAERKARSVFWQCCEPSGPELDALASAIRRDCLKHQAWYERFRTFRNGAAIAATFAVVFGSGWMSRGRIIADQRDAQAAQPEVALADNGSFSPTLPARNMPVIPASTFPVPQVAPWTTETAGWNYPLDPNHLSTVRPNYHVVLLDPMGTPIDSQEIDDVRDPQKVRARFAEFESRLQSAQHTANFATQTVPPGR